jgi:hypothetical protein
MNCNKVTDKEVQLLYHETHNITSVAQSVLCSLETNHQRVNWEMTELHLAHNSILICAEG